MPIVTSHHVVPDPLQGGLAGAGIQASGGSGAPMAAVENATSTAGAGGFHVGYAPLIAFLAILLALAVAAILASTRQPPMSENSWVGEWGEEPPNGMYTYRGARARLRRVFLRVRARFEPMLGSRIRAVTARELAMLDPGLSPFALEYSRAMYSRLEPGEGDVERITRLVGEES